MKKEINELKFNRIRNAQNNKIKRPTTEGKYQVLQFKFREPTINTYDGRVFFKKNDGSDSIEHIVTTDSITTGPHL